MLASARRNYTATSPDLDIRGFCILRSHTGISPSMYNHQPCQSSRRKPVCLAGEAFRPLPAIH